MLTFRYKNSGPDHVSSSCARIIKMPLSTLLLGISYVATVSASVSRQIQLGKYEYFVPPTPAWKLDSWNVSAEHDEFTPLTVVKLNGTANTARVSSALREYEDDDVWTKAFAQGESMRVIYGLI
jgi:hypothetical protein